MGRSQRAMRERYTEDRRGNKHAPGGGFAAAGDSGGRGLPFDPDWGAIWPSGSNSGAAPSANTTAAAGGVTLTGAGLPAASGTITVTGTATSALTAAVLLRVSGVQSQATVDIASGSDANTIAAAIGSAINALSGYTGSATTNTVDFSHGSTISDAQLYLSA